MTNEEKAIRLEKEAAHNDHLAYAAEEDLRAGAAALRALEWRPIDPKNDDYDGPEDSFLVGRLLPDGRPQWEIEGRQDTAYRRGFRFMTNLIAPPKEGV